MEPDCLLLGSVICGAELSNKLYNQRDEVSYYIQQHKSSCS